MSLPLAGRIAAGSPLLAVEQNETIDFSGLFGSDNQFCLKVTGNSMIEAQIADGEIDQPPWFARLRLEQTSPCMILENSKRSPDERNRHPEFSLSQDARRSLC